MPISLVRFAPSLPATGSVPTFLGVAAFRLMPDHAHDVGLMLRLVEGILHRLAIHRQRLVLGAPGLIPRIERPIQRPRFDPYQAVSNHIFAGNDIASVLTPAAETLRGLAAPRHRPNRRWPCTRASRTGWRPPRCPAPPAGDGAALAAARIGNGSETLRQQAHLFGIERTRFHRCDYVTRRGKY